MLGARAFSGHRSGGVRHPVKPCVSAPMPHQPVASMWALQPETTMKTLSIQAGVIASLLTVTAQAADVARTELAKNNWDLSRNSLDTLALPPSAEGDE